MSDQIDQKEAFAAEMREVSGQAPATTEVNTPTEKVEVVSEKSETVAKDIDSATFDINSLPPAAQQLLEAERKRAADLDTRYREADRDRRSLRGRIPHLEKKLADWENEHRRAASPPRAHKDTSAAQSPQGKQAPAASTLQSLPGWPKLRQIFADDAAPIEEAFTALESHNQKLAERLEHSETRMAKMEELLEKDVRPRFEKVDALEKYREEEHHEHASQEVRKARDSLTTKYPDYKSHIKHVLDDENNIVDTEMSDEFYGWIETKPGRIHELFGKDATREDVDFGLSLFYRDVVNTGAYVDPVKQQQAADALRSRQDQLSKRAVQSSNGTALNAEGKLSAAEQYRREMQTNFS